MRTGDFAADLERVEAFITLIAGSPERVSGRTHPTFGRMSTPAWLRWAYLHVDHHLRQFGA